MSHQIPFLSVLLIFSPHLTAIKDSYFLYDFSCDQPAVDIICEQDVESQIKQNDYCGQIKDPNGPFGECVNAILAEDHQYLEDLFDMCVSEVCQVWNNTDAARERACDALTAFEMEECTTRLLNEPVGDYRTAANCPTSMCFSFHFP